ncbi:hypothetical protein B0H19DRAFT_1196930, partial [Mycena capillaripes]
MCKLRIVNLARLCSCCGMWLLWQRYHLCAVGQIEARNYLNFGVFEASPSFETREPRDPSPGGAAGVNICYLSSFQFHSFYTTVYGR